MCQWVNQLFFFFREMKMAEFNSENTENSCKTSGNDFRALTAEQGLDKSSDSSSDTSDIGCSGSSSILCPPRMVHNPFAVKVGTPTRSMADSTDHKESRPILAPATLVLGRCTNDSETTSNSVSSSFKLKPPILNNPFLKVDTSQGKRADGSEVSTTREVPDYGGHSDVAHGNGVAFVGGSLDKHEGSTRKISLEVGRNPKAASNCHPHGGATVASRKFSLPAGHYSQFSGENSFSSFTNSSNTNNPVTSGSPSEQSHIGFVFGQNMNERVTNVRLGRGITNGKSAQSFQGTDKSFVSSSENSDSTNYSKQFDLTMDNSNDAGEAAKQVKSLTESALEYESRQVKRTYEEVTVVTGEEDESNVLQMNCKLYSFDKKTSSWVEKGRGLLRLNDKELEDGSIQSRLVARTQGSLRVVLNTKIWAGMSVDRPNSKSVRLTVLDGEVVRVFLVSGSTKDIDLLFGALDWRVTTLRTSEERKAVESAASSSAATSAASFTIGDETISSSGTSPPSPRHPYGATSSCSSISISSSSSSTSTSPGSAATQVLVGDGMGQKKRRISPPSALDEDDSCLGSSSTDSRIQERRVDSTDTVDSNSCDDSNLSFASSSTV